MDGNEIPRDDARVRMEAGPTPMPAKSHCRQAATQAASSNRRYRTPWDAMRRGEMGARNHYALGHARIGAPHRLSCASSIPRSPVSTTVRSLGEHAARLCQAGDDDGSGAQLAPVLEAVPRQHIDTRRADGCRQLHVVRMIPTVKERRRSIPCSRSATRRKRGFGLMQSQPSDRACGQTKTRSMITPAVRRRPTTASLTRATCSRLSPPVETADWLVMMNSAKSSLELTQDLDHPGRGSMSAGSPRSPRSAMMVPSRSRKMACRPPPAPSAWAFASGCRMGTVKANCAVGHGFDALDRDVEVAQSPSPTE